MGFGNFFRVLMGFGLIFDELQLFFLYFGDGCQTAMSDAYVILGQPAILSVLLGTLSI